jgi:hypothetical protein
MTTVGSPELASFLSISWTLVLINPDSEAAWWIRNIRGRATNQHADLSRGALLGSRIRAAIGWAKQK